MSEKYVRARQLEDKSLIQTSGGEEEGDVGDWVVVDEDNHVYLRSNGQFSIMYEETGVRGIYKEK